MIEGQNLEFLKKNGGYFPQNNKTLAIEKRIEDMANGDSNQRLGADGLAIKSTDTRQVKEVPKNYFFQLTNEYYDLSLKVNSNSQCVLVPSVKHELLRTLKLDPAELDNIKNIFVEFSSKHRGIDFDGFKDMLAEVFGIFDYPFAAPLFNYFDKKGDGLIDFMEFAESINTMYKCDIIVKARYIFEVIDFHKMKNIGIREINKVFEIAFVDVFIDLKAVYNYFLLLKANLGKINMRDLFNNTNIVNKMHKTIDIVLDRNESLKLYVTILEIVHGFDIYKLQRLWELYKMYFIKNYDMIKIQMQKKDAETREVETLLMQNLFRSEDYMVESEPSPFELTAQQFKITMRELFKIQDVQLLDDLFGNICGGQKYGKCLLEHFFESITYYFNCKFELKVALVFEVYCVVRNTSEIPHDCVIEHIGGLFEVYWEYYKEAKQIIDEILEGQEIKFLSYKNLEAKLIENPQKLDFLFRFTLGKYSDFGMHRKDTSQLYLEFAEQDREKKTKLKADKTLAIGYKNWSAK